MLRDRIIQEAQMRVMGGAMKASGYTRPWE
jgi:hypothetical protein